MKKKRIWDIRRYILEIKIGGFILVALALLFITLLSIREVNLFKGTYLIKAKFDFAEGLRPSSPVRFSGVDVGEVQKVIVESENYTPIVTVFAKIYNDIKIPEGSYFFVNSLSLFGEKYLEIMPSSGAKDYLKPGDVVEGISPVPLFNVFVSFHKTMKEISEFVKEGKIKTSFENILFNLEQGSLEFKELVEDVRNKNGTIGRLIYDDSIYQKSEELLDDLKMHPWKILYKPKEIKARKR